MLQKIIKVHDHCRVLYSCVSNIQRSFDAKIEVLCTYWDRLYLRVNTKAIKLDDAPTIQILSKIREVPEEIRTALLTGYLSQCIKYHAVAFFQWRYQNPKRTKKEKETLARMITSKFYDLHNLEGKRE